MTDEKYILCGITALRAIRKLRIEGYHFKVQSSKAARLPSTEEIHEVENIFCLSAGLPQQQIKKHQAFELNFLVGAKFWKKSFKNAVITHHSGSWKGVTIQPVRDKKLEGNTNKDFEIPANLGIVSPAFLVLQLSSFLSFEELLLLALEFCGTYAVGRNFHITTNDSSLCSNTTNDTDEPKLYTGLKPIMKLQEIESLIQTFNNYRMNGMTKLKNVARYLQSFSASPMESRLYANLALPTTCGGFNLPNLKFNYSIRLSSVAAAVAQQQTVIVDLCDIRAKTIIEYDSRAFHSAINQSQKDKHRRDGLEIDKFKCFSITTDQLNNYDTFFNYAKQIMHSIKGRARIRTKNFDEVAFLEYSALRKASFEIAML